MKRKLDHSNEVRKQSKFIINFDSLPDEIILLIFGFLYEIYHKMKDYLKIIESYFSLYFVNKRINLLIVNFKAKIEWRFLLSELSIIKEYDLLSIKHNIFFKLSYFIYYLALLIKDLENFIHVNGLIYRSKSGRIYRGKIGIRKMKKIKINDPELKNIYKRKINYYNKNSRLKIQILEEIKKYTIK